MLCHVMLYLSLIGFLTLRYVELRYVTLYLWLIADAVSTDGAHLRGGGEVDAAAARFKVHLALQGDAHALEVEAGRAQRREHLAHAVVP